MGALNGHLQNKLQLCAIHSSVCPQRLKLNHHSSTNIKLFNVCNYKTSGESDSQPICLLSLSCYGNKLRQLAEVWFDCSAKQRVPLFTNSHLPNFILKKNIHWWLNWIPVRFVWSCSLSLVVVLAKLSQQERYQPIPLFTYLANFLVN